MTYFDSLSFVYQLVWARLDAIAWIFAIVAAAFSFFVLHWLWGCFWNSHWTPFKQLGVAFLSIAIALVVLMSALLYVAAGRGVVWVDLQRAELARQFTDSGTRNRRIFIDVAERIGQAAAVSGNSLTIGNERDLLVLAEIAAADVRCPLMSSGPLGYGAPCNVRDAASVARDVVRAIPAVAFPITVSPDNPWIKAAVTAQLEEALSYAAPKLRKGMTELREFLLFGVLLVLAIQAVAVPLAAVSDIRSNPSV